MTTKIPVNIAAQVVAAGIFGKQARITLALTPVFDKNGGYDLAEWPKQVEEKFLVVQGNKFHLDVVPLGEKQSWRTKDVLNAPKQIEMTRVAPPKAGDVAKLTAYWQAVMQGIKEPQNNGAVKDGFDYLYRALDPADHDQLRDPIDEAMRPDKDNVDNPDNKPKVIPDIHGTSRSKAAQELVLERARHVLGRFGKMGVKTRPFADPAKSLSQKVNKWRDDKRIGPWPNEEADLTAATLAALVEDDESWKALKKSRERADAFAIARGHYQDGESARNAICELVKAHDHLLARSPLAAAQHFSSDGLDIKSNAGDPIPEAIAAYRLASQTPTFNGVNRDAGVQRDTEADKRHIEFARRRLYMLQGNPSLGRLFRFVVDFTCPVALLADVVKGVTNDKWHGYEETVLDRPPGASDELPDALKQFAYFLLIRFVKDNGPRLWSIAKIRLPNDDFKTRAAGHFLPCTREEIDARAMDAKCEKECKDDPNSQACRDCKACADLSTDLRTLAVAEQIDGIVDLGQRWHEECRYEVITLDPIVATAAEDQKLKRDAENAHTLDKLSSGIPPFVRAAMQNPQNGTHRGGGLALADRWRQPHAIGRHLDSRQQKQQYEQQRRPNQVVDVFLDASDLVAGYKLDVGVLDKADLDKTTKKYKRRRWHTLMHRTVTYTQTKDVPAGLTPNLDGYIAALYPDAATRQDAEDGQLQAPAALRDWTTSLMRTQISEQHRDWITAFMEEVIGAWRGDPLGLACGLETHTLSQDDVRIDVTYKLPTDQELTPPPLRFGWRYHFGLRAFFAGGVSMPLSRALGHYEKSYSGDLVQPAVPAQGAPGGARFRRHERIDGPTIAVPEWMFGALTRKKEEHHTKVELIGRFPVPQAARMVVRRFDDETNRRIAGISDISEKDEKITPGLGFDRRVLMAPPVPLHFAALHDAFRGKSGDEDIETNVQMCEPRVLLGDKPDPNDPFETDAIKDEEDIEIEFTPVSKDKKPPVNPNEPNPPVPVVWGKVRVAWRPYVVKSRPRGGLRNVDHRAAWGGFPVYRAKASAGLVPPQEKALVVRPAPMTDEGEILHRVKGDAIFIFDKDKTKRRQLYWSAVGVFDKEEGQGDRSGTAVFRAADLFKDVPTERLPYYPDPAAVTLVIEVTIRGQQQSHREQVPFYLKPESGGSAPADYPHAMPVVLDLVRGNGTEKTVIVNAGTTNYRKILPTSKDAPLITAAYVKVTLAPGDEATIRCWCAPSLAFLSYMWAQLQHVAELAVVRGFGRSLEGMDMAALRAEDVDAAFVKGLAELTGLKNHFSQVKNATRPGRGTGCLPLPSDEQMIQFAKDLHSRLLEAPLSEVAAVTEIEAVHAVDLPAHEPRPVNGRKWQLLRAKTETIDVLLKPEKDCKADLDKINLGALCMSANWTPENQMPDSVDVLIDGSLTVHGPSTDAVEIRARGTAVARGRFDDVERGRSRDDRARGLWPKPDAQVPMKPKLLFGFDPVEDGSIVFAPETVTLLRIEGFTPRSKDTGGSEVHLDLLTLQRDARAIEPKPGEQIMPHDPPLRATRPAAFPDTRARWIEIYTVAISRHAAALRTRYDELPDALTKPASGQPNATSEDKQKVEQLIGKAIIDRRWLPATVRPARIAALSSLPSFLWGDSTPKPIIAKLPRVFVSRSVRIRIRIKRPWFSSGEGERVGVVLWPPNLFDKDVGNVRYDMVKPPPTDRKEINLRTLPEDGTVLRELQDADLGPGGAWVTRWGADPILAQGGVQGWLLSKENFPGWTRATNVFTKNPPVDHPKDAVLVDNVLMPVPADADAAELRVAQPPGGFMAVSLLTYTPRFDPDQENWYVDLNIDPCGAVYPKVRLGLVRYQPNAKRELRVSEPILEWARLMPDRKLTASAKYIDRERKQIEVTAIVEGLSSGPGDNNGHPESSPAQAPQMLFTLKQRRREREDELPGSESDFEDPQVLGPNCGSSCASWTAVFRMKEDEYRRYAWAVCVEEADRLRPGSYADEPRYQTKEDTNFANTGPRFVARLPLDNLEVM